MSLKFEIWRLKFGLLSEAGLGRMLLCDWSRNRSCIRGVTLIWGLCFDLVLGHLLAVGADEDVLAVVVRDGALD